MIYLAEPDSPNVIVFAKAKANVGCLLIGEAEVIAVFHRKLRESIVGVTGFHLLCDQFEADCASGLREWRAVLLSACHFVFRKARSLLFPFSSRQAGARTSSARMRLMAARPSKLACSLSPNIASGRRPEKSTKRHP